MTYCNCLPDKLTAHLPASLPACLPAYRHARIHGHVLPVSAQDRLVRKKASHKPNLKLRPHVHRALHPKRHTGHHRPLAFQRDAEAFCRRWCFANTDSVPPVERPILCRCGDPGRSLNALSSLRLLERRKSTKSGSCSAGSRSASHSTRSGCSWSQCDKNFMSTQLNSGAALRKLAPSVLCGIHGARRCFCRLSAGTPAADGGSTAVCSEMSAREGFCDTIQAWCWSVQALRAEVREMKLARSGPPIRVPAADSDASHSRAMSGASCAAQGCWP